MASDRKQKQSNSIPISFFDDEESRVAHDSEESRDDEGVSPPSPDDPSEKESRATGESRSPGEGGPAVAELVATSAELKRLQAELAEAKDALGRRQADLDNYLKRIDRERGVAYNPIGAQIAGEHPPVLHTLFRP